MLRAVAPKVITVESRQTNTSATGRAAQHIEVVDDAHPGGQEKEGHVGQQKIRLFPDMLDFEQPVANSASKKDADHAGREWNWRCRPFSMSWLNQHTAKMTPI